MNATTERFAPRAASLRVRAAGSRLPEHVVTQSRAQLSSPWVGGVFWKTPRNEMSDYFDDEEQRMLIMRKAFQMFDTQKTGFIETIKISTILNTMGQLFDEGELQDLIDEEDPESTGRVNFDGFANIASNFLQEEEDAEAMQQELKEAFRLYDREGNGYITTSTLKEILKALDDKLSNEDLDGIIGEIDTDGSGTVDFDEFMEMMTGE
uniref:EF-hand domain-containing protein n=1 Tax=Anopheles farauti TaxID=69004 RepID=A0A182R0S1_9DIPT